MRLNMMSPLDLACIFEFNNGTECVEVQITYLVGIPVFILLLLAVLVLSTAVCCMGMKLRSKKQRWAIMDVLWK